MWTHGLAWLSGAVAGFLCGVIATAITEAFVLRWWLRKYDEQPARNEWGITDEDVRKDLFSEPPRAMVLPRGSRNA